MSIESERAELLAFKLHPKQILNVEEFFYFKYAICQIITVLKILKNCF